jgi:hypothetical protein
VEEGKEPSFFFETTLRGMYRKFSFLLISSRWNMESWSVGALAIDDIRFQIADLRPRQSRHGKLTKFLNLHSAIYNLK